MRSLPIPVFSQLQFVYPQRAGNQLMTDLVDFLTASEPE